MGAEVSVENLDGTSEAMARNRDGKYVPSIPLPLYVGWRMRLAQCTECHVTFKNEAGYRGHYALVHILRLD